MADKKYILALDEGTTSARAILFDKNANIIGLSQQEIPQIFPHPAWVEQNPMDIYASQYAAMTECVLKSGISPSEIAGIGITNQRETTIVWDAATSKPIFNAIVWQCRRTSDICEKLLEAGEGDYIAKTTGLRVDAYFSATKIKWILDNVEGAREKADKGELRFGTVDTWLVWKLTGGKVYVTDRTNASRTMLYNIDRGDWDDRLLNLFGIPRSMLPEIRSSSEIYGYTEILGEKIPISGIAGDQQAALFGQCCFSEGDAKNTYGTGCFLLSHTGNRRVTSSHGLVTTAAATEAGKPREFALEGSVFVGGAVIQWLRDEMRLIAEAKDSEYFAEKVPDCAGVYLVPAFSGLGAPYWDMNARGVITGLTRGANTNHIIRAALESIAYQSNDLLEAMRSDTGTLSSLRVDGGASANNFLMQFQADISGISVIRAGTTEATALGAAFLAGLATGFFSDREELKRLNSQGKAFEPAMSTDKRTELITGWKKAVKASCGNLSTTG